MRKTPDGKKIENFDLCERRVLEQSRQYWNVHKIEASRDIFGLDQAIVVVQRKIVSLIIIIWITWLVCFCLQIWRLCSQPRNCDLRFSLGRGKEICVFSWGQFIGSRYYCYFYYCFWRYFFFIWCMIWGKNLEHEPFGEQIYVCFPLKFFLSFSALGRFC